jgi:hypothetical protein
VAEAGHPSSASAQDIVAGRTSPWGDAISVRGSIHVMNIMETNMIDKCLTSRMHVGDMGGWRGVETPPFEIRSRDERYFCIVNVISNLISPSWINSLCLRGDIS